VRRQVLVAALVLVPALAWGERGRFRWRGVTAASDGGKAPARLDAAAQAEVVVALRPLGVEVVDKGAADAEGTARCAFPTGKPAQCAVEVLRYADGVHAERRAEIPYRDADDLARSLALLLADTLQMDLPSLSAEPQPEEPQPEKPPRQKASDRSHSEQPPEKTGDHPPEKPPTKIEKPSPPFPIAKLFIDVGPTLAIGFSGEPLLYGAQARASWVMGPLRVGGVLSMTGNRDVRDGFELSFLRVVTGPRGGVGFQSGRLAFDASLGPALFVLSTDAQPGGHHTLVAAAACLGARLAIALAKPVALALSADGTLMFTEGFIDAGPVRVADFGRLSLEVAISLSYRR
jgi:hypothetical protein